MYRHQIWITSILYLCLSSSIIGEVGRPQISLLSILGQLRIIQSFVPCQDMQFCIAFLAAPSSLALYSQPPREPCASSIFWLAVWSSCAFFFFPPLPPRRAFP